MSVSKVPLATNNYKGPRRSLLLAGGGMRLAYQAGVVKALQEEGLQFNHVDGTSGGIFNTAMLASGVPAEEMGQKWRNVTIKNFTSPSPVKSYFKPLKMMGYTDADGIREKVFPTLGINLSKINSNTEFLSTFNVCNFTDKSVENIPNNKVKEDHLIAGVSLPIVMPALYIDGKWYSDSVWIKDANLVEAVKQGADEIWLVWAIGNCSEYLPGALNQYVHMIEMSANGGLLEEYAQIKLILEKRNVAKDNPAVSKTIRFHVIKPEIPLPLDTDLYLNKIDVRTLINWGYADAKKYIENDIPKGIPFDLDATKMQSPGIRLNYRCTFEANLLFDKRKMLIRYYPAFCFRQIDNRSEIIVYSSIAIGESKNEISTYKNRVDLAKNIIRINSHFIFNEEAYTLQVEIKLNSTLDWLLGLEFKRVHVRISKYGTDNMLALEGFLVQKIKYRLQSLFTSNIRKPDGSGGSVFKKIRFISKFYNQ